MRPIDIHAHAMPMPLLAWLEGEGLADLSGVDTSAPSGIVRLDPRVSGVAPGAPLPLARSQWDVPVRLAEMAAQGIGHHAVSLPPFLFCSTAADVDLATEVVRRGNDALAAYVAEAPDRLSALATAPVGTDAAASEAARCLDSGARGIAIGTRGAGRELDDEANEELWALLTDRGAFTFLHPSGVPDLSRMTDYYLPQLLGYPMETAVAVTRLVMSGVRERHSFPLCLAHGGGCLPWVRGRLDMGWERKDVARVAPRAPGSYLRDLYFDSAVFSDELLQHLVDDFGADRIVIGTDFPFELAEREPLAAIDRLRIGDTARAAIVSGTAARLLGLSEAL